MATLVTEARSGLHDGTPVTTEYWSPNRIVFQSKPGHWIAINQNPGSWWRVNGRQAFPQDNAEWTKPFEAQADARGRLELEIVPEGLLLGWGLHAGGMCVVARCRCRLPQGEVKTDSNLAGSRHSPAELQTTVDWWRNDLVECHVAASTRKRLEHLAIKASCPNAGRQDEELGSSRS